MQKKREKTEEQIMKSCVVNVRTDEGTDKQEPNSYYTCTSAGV